MQKIQKTQRINIIGAHSAKALLIQGLSRHVNKPIIINLTVGNRQLEITFGVENEIVYDVFDYLNGTCRLEQAIITTDEDIPVMASAFRNKYSIAEDDVSNLIEQLPMYQTFLISSDKMIKDCDQYIIFSHPHDGVENAYWISSDPLTWQECKNHHCLGVLNNCEVENFKSKSFNIDREIINLLRRYRNGRKYYPGLLGRFFR